MLSVRSVNKMMDQGSLRNVCHHMEIFFAVDSHCTLFVRIVHTIDTFG